MSDDKATVWEDCCGDFGFRVRFDYSSHWCDVEAWEIEARDGATNAPEFHRKGATSGPDSVPNVEDAERYLVGFIKWDGCSEFRFAPDLTDNSFGHFHWCGPHAYRKHFALLEHLYKRAQDLMPSGNDDPW